MRIKQCRMLNTKQEKKFKNFFKKYSLYKYDNSKNPVIFFSSWGYGPLRDHKGLVVVIWRGTDIIKMERRLKHIKKMKNVYHIAISSYIAKDLDKYGIKYKYIPIVGVDLKYFKPCVMGDEIYTYIPTSKTNKYYDRYGMKIIKNIQKKCKYKINIINSSTKYSRREIADIYERCFCSLRMTKHDGLPNQVLEMGLMGRKSFYNGDIPDSIKWNKNIDKIIENIDIEACKIGTIDYDYPKRIEDFLDIGKEWLYTKFWNKKEKKGKIRINE